MIVAQAKQPIPMTFLIFHAVVVAVLALLQPPLLLNALGAIGFGNGVYVALVPKQ